VKTLLVLFLLNAQTGERLQMEIVSMHSTPEECIAHVPDSIVTPVGGQLRKYECVPASSGN